MKIEIRKAGIGQVRDIQALVNASAGQGLMLPRALSDLYEYIRDFFVAVDSDTGAVIGACALHVCWESLGEVRSLVVDPAYQRHGVGRDLVRHCIREARELGLSQLFALTYVPGFFRKLGFEDYPKEKLPHKVWSDCIKCHKFPDCDENAVAMNL
ncbi:N-acetyltransferase [bacterium]|nr:N-acetyltransferase [bacterium]